MDGLIRLYYDHSLHYLSKEMWRKAMALSIEAPDSPFSQRYTELDAMLVGAGLRPDRVAEGPRADPPVS